MKAMKLVLATSVLAALSTGAAQASVIATYNVTNSGLISGLTTGTVTQTGTATLDVTGSAGTLTIQTVGITSTLAGGTFTLHDTTTYSGAFSGGVLTLSTGTHTNTACEAGTSTCSAQLRLGVTDVALSSSIPTGDGGGLPLTAVSGGISYDAFFTAGSLGSTENILNRNYSQNHALITVNKLAFTNTTAAPPAVPVPAAAWLFGSGLMGLFGTARRRRATAAA
jgi:hypothetical protein